MKGCMKETWYGPNPGWMQYDDSVDVDENGEIISIGGFPINDSWTYRIGSFQDLHIDYGEQPTLAQYFEENPKGDLLRLITIIYKYWNFRNAHF